MKEETMEKYILVKFIKGFDPEKEEILLKCHSVWDTENNFNWSSDYAQKGYTRKYGSFIFLELEDYKEYKKCLLLAPPDFPHSLNESLDIYLDYIKEKNQEQKKEFENKLTILDLKSASFSDDFKKEYIEKIDKKKEKRKRKRKSKVF